jgi:hypothetical protein
MPCVLKNSMIHYGLISCQGYLFNGPNSIPCIWPTQIRKKLVRSESGPCGEVEQLGYHMVRILIAPEKVQGSRLIASFADPEHVCTSTKYFALIKAGNNCQSQEEWTKT